MTPPSFAERIQLLEQALSDTPHAFGGALALAYYAEPRTTIDIDLNVFVTVGKYDLLVERLAALQIPADAPEVRDVLTRDGQGRVFWDDVPIDLFLSYDDFHVAAAGARRIVPFGEGSIQILSPEHLMVCKVVFNRPKDWIDVDAMLVGEDVAVEAAEVVRWAARLAGDEDPRYERIVGLLTRR